MKASASELAELACHAARLAGRQLVARGEGFDGVELERGRDIKLRADRAAETLIVSTLRANSEIPVLGEETGRHGGEDDWLWVVDPLDGSANYDRRIPICAVSIALMRDGVPVLGAIYDFNRDEMFCGGEDVPARINQAPLCVSDVSEKSRAVLITGLPVSADYSAEALGAMAARFADWKKVRMLGSAALAAAYVADGRVDRYAETGALLWDVAAGMAIVRAAGGRAVISEGASDAPRSVLVDNGRLPD